MVSAITIRQESLQPEASMVTTTFLVPGELYRAWAVPWPLTGAGVQKYETPVEGSEITLADAWVLSQVRVSPEQVNCGSLILITAVV